MNCLEKIDFGPDEKIITQGEVGEALYIIDAGRVRIVKESEENRIVGMLQETDFFGELSLFTGKPRAASVIAVTGVTVFRLSKDDFVRLSEAHPNINGTFLKKLYNRLTDSYRDLEKKNEALQLANQQRMELGSVFTSVVLIISVYTFMLGLFTSGLFAGTSPMILFVLNRLLEIVTLYVIVRIVMKSSLPISSFGVTLQGWRPALKESAIVSAVAMVLLYLFKTAAVVYGWDFLPNGRVVDWGYFDWTYLTYIVVAPLQEFITRGVLQSSIQRLLVGRYAWLWAIVITSFLFGALHLHASLNLGIAALVTGWLWGWMYARHQTLIGVGLCHFIIGNWAGLLGIWTIF